MKRVVLGAAGLPLALLVACGNTVATSTVGTGGGTPTSSSTTTGSTTTSTSTSTTTTTTTSTTTTAPLCVPSCQMDADCQASCPPATGASNCCDVVTSLCYVSAAPACPVSTCVDGAACKPSDLPCTDLYTGCSCACGADDHLSCSLPLPVTPCPSIHPTCGDPCVSPPHTCTCSLGPGQGPVGCLCGSSGTWECAASGPCPPFADIVGFTFGDPCADFPANLVCPLAAPTWSCVCEPFCGTRVWSCDGI